MTDVANQEIGMIVHYTPTSGRPGKAGWMMRILIGSGIAGCGCSRCLDPR